MLFGATSRLGSPFRLVEQDRTKSVPEMKEGPQRWAAKRMSGQSQSEVDRAFPTVEDGVKGLAFVKAAMESSARRQWVDFEMPSI